LNADETLYGIVHGTKINSNDFVYCGNDPVNRVDSEGHFWKKVIKALEKSIKKVNSVVSPILHGLNTKLVKAGFKTAKLAEMFLNMKEIGKTGIYYAKFDCWQEKFGYCDLYDILFSMGTDMQTDRYIFQIDSFYYCFWLWKGDYINLGAGAELGIYYTKDLSFWNVNKNLALNMKMTLHYMGKCIIYREAFAWWMTGFNSNYINVKAKDLSARFVIDLSTRDKWLRILKGLYGGRKYSNISFSRYSMTIVI
jgi:hypothetical protein